MENAKAPPDGAWDLAMAPFGWPGLTGLSGLTGAGGIVLPPINKLLLESNDYLLQESGYKIVLEEAAFSPIYLNPALWLDATTGLVTDGAASFASASSQYFSRADTADLSAGDIDFWVSAWVKLASTGTLKVVVGKGSSGTTNTMEWFVEITSTNLAKFVVANGSSYTSVSATTFGALSSGTWYCLVAWHDSVSNTINISVNGVTDSAAWSGGSQDTAHEFTIGSYPLFHSDYFNGQLDNVAFGKNPVGGIAALATTIRDALYNSGSGVPYSSLTSAQKTAWGLVSWYDFASPGSGLVADSHGSNTLTNNNGVTYAAGVVSGNAAADGDPVTTDQDQSGNSRDHAAATAAKRPSLKLNILNSKPGLLFDGVDDYLTRTNFSLGTTYTAFVVLNTTDDSDDLVLAGATDYLLYLNADTMYSSNAAGFVSVAATIPNGSPVICAVRRNGTTVQFFTNGAQRGTDQTLASNAAVSIGGLGAYSGGGNYFKGYIHDAFVCPTSLSDSDMTAMWSYLNSKWAVY